MDKLQRLLTQIGRSGSTFETMNARDYEQSKVDVLNSSEGTLHETDGYDCPLCKNRGYIARLEELPSGGYTQAVADCKCREIRRSIRRMKNSGLGNVITACTFERYEVTTDWQRMLRNKAVAYSENPRGWFFLCGQSGIGKSHLCTAICRKFLLEGRQVVYMAWRDDIAVLKSFDGESNERVKLLERFKRAEVLYIDDLFKSGKRPDGGKARPTTADINNAFEIINYRYNQPNLLTIVSSELTMAELLDIDEATGGRIFERAGEFGINVSPDSSKNFRLRRAVTI